MEKLVVSNYRAAMMHGWTHGRGVIAWERVQFEFPLKVCSHLTSAFAFASTSPSKFNIASMETQTQTHRVGLNPFLMFYIDAMLNIAANANIKSNLFKLCSHLKFTFAFAFASTSPLRSIHTTHLRLRLCMSLCQIVTIVTLCLWCGRVNAENQYKTHSLHLRQMVYFDASVNEASKFNIAPMETQTQRVGPETHSWRFTLTQCWTLTQIQTSSVNRPLTLIVSANFFNFSISCRHAQKSF